MHGGPHQIVFVGFGAVARCLFELIPKKEPGWTDLPIVIIDPRKDLSEDPVLQGGTKYKNQITVINEGVNRENLSTFFDKYVLEGGVVFDLSFRINTHEILRECDKRGCIYANTSIDEWEGEEIEDWEEEDMEEYSLAYMREVLMEKCRNHSTTAILNHGMNPGLVSHFAKHTIKKLYAQIYGEEKDYSTMARELGLTTIHISERDTQKTGLQVSERRLINTWSVKGLFDESIDPAQISWGSHENQFFEWLDENHIEKYGQVFIPVRGMQIKLRSYEPRGGYLIGLCIPHAESASLSKLINRDDYRISVYYVYNLPDVAKVSTHYMESLKDDYDYYVLRAKDIERGGYDSVGCLMFFRGKRIWTGAVQPVERAMELNPEINGTCLQVAISILASVRWGVENPNRGVIDPEEIDTEFVLKYCDYWMGDFISRDVTEDTVELSDRFNELLVCPKPSIFDWEEDH
jgi:homospermidine synthase